MMTAAALSLEEAVAVRQAAALRLFREGLCRWT